MVLGDEILNGLWEPICPSDGNPVCDVANDPPGVGNGIQILIQVGKTVLREESRTLDLADVVIKSSYPHQTCIRSDAESSSFCQRADDQAVVVGAGRFGPKEAEQGVAGIQPPH